MKNKLYQSGELIIRILDSTDDEMLVIDCVKQTMPIWITASDITSYKLISEVDLLKVIENIPELDDLENEQIRVMHERYTMLTSVIPYIGDIKLRHSKIAEVSEEYKVSKQSVRSYLCKCLSYMQDLISRNFLEKYLRREEKVRNSMELIPEHLSISRSRKRKYLIRR